MKAESGKIGKEINRSSSGAESGSREMPKEKENISLLKLRRFKVFFSLTGNLDEAWDVQSE